MIGKLIRIYAVMRVSVWFWYVLSSGTRDLASSYPYSTDNAYFYQHSNLCLVTRIFLLNQNECLVRYKCSCICKVSNSSNFVLLAIWQCDIAINFNRTSSWKVMYWLWDGFLYPLDEGDNEEIDESLKVGMKMSVEPLSPYNHGLAFSRLDCVIYFLAAHSITW